jgi:hypothetical protein
VLVFAFAFVSAIIMLWYSERHAVRSPRWYALAGMASPGSGLVLFDLAWQSAVQHDQDLFRTDLFNAQSGGSSAS